ncbi:hypothetical protein [Nostoc sp. ChiQUE02]
MQVVLVSDRPNSLTDELMTPVNSWHNFNQALDIAELLTRTLMRKKRINS